MTSGQLDVTSAVLSYVPSLALRRLAASPSDLALPDAESFPAVVLFADIAGSSALAERLAEHGSVGVEQLSTHLNAYFDRLIEVIRRHHGNVHRFAGDAILALWPVVSETETLRDQTVRAARCGLDIQTLLHNYPIGEDGRLSLRVGVAAGNVVAAHVGGVRGERQFMLAGAPFLEAGLANQNAQPGEVFASRDLADGFLAGASVTHSGAHYVRLDAVTATAEEPAPVADEAPEVSVAEAARAYVLPAVLSRLDSGQTDWLAELRRVTSMFVNVQAIDFSTPGALARLQHITTTVQTTLGTYEGSLCQLIMADKGIVLHCVFGLPPFAHGDDAERAILAALSVVADLARQDVGCSVGLATGNAFCGPIGNGSRREYNVLGSAINLAAGLAVVAGSGVMCDGQTRQAAESRVAFEALPAVQVKGRPEPLAVFRPMHPLHARADRPMRGRGALIGRARERAAVVERIQRLANARTGGVMVIEGEAGMGKSRLVSDMIDQARLLGVHVLIGAADPIERTTPYFALRPIFGELIADEAALGDEFQPHMPLLNAVLDRHLPDTDTTRTMTDQARADYTRELLVRGLQLAAATEPLLLVVEDAHWLDSASWAMTRLASERVDSLLLVLATRPSGGDLTAESRQLVLSATTLRIVLGGLTREEVVELARQRLGVASLPRPVERFLWEKTEGHPLYVEELASALRDTGALIVQDNQARMASSAVEASALTFPPTLQGAITARIDRLTSSQQLTMKVASVIGREFSIEALRAVHPTGGGTDVARDLEALEDLELAHHAASDPEPTYAFRHVLTQEVAYNLMLFAQRRQLHRAAAEWYERTDSGNDVTRSFTQLAHHWTHALRAAREEPHVASRAIEYLDKAGEQASASFAHLEAIRLFEQALQIDAALEGARHPHRTGGVGHSRQARWERRLGESYFRAGRAPEAIQHLRRAVSLMGAPLPTSQVGLALGLVRDGAQQVLHSLLPAVFQNRAPGRMRDDLSGAADIYASLSLYSFINMQELASLGALVRGQNLAERAGPSAVLMRTSYQMASFAGLVFGPKQFERYMRRAQEVAPRAHDPASEGEMWFGGRGLYMITQARWAEADAATEHASQLFSSVGDRRWLELSLFQRANIAHFQGDVANSFALSRQALASAETRGDTQMQAWLVIQQAHLLLLQGQARDALAHLDDADQRLASSFTILADPAAELWSAATRALALANLGERAAALSTAEAAALRIKPYLNFMYYSARGFGNLAEAALLLWETMPDDDLDARRIRRLVKASVAAASAFGQRSPLGRAQALLWRGVSEQLGGKPERAQRTWASVVSWAPKAGMPYEEALARYRLGRHTRTPGSERHAHLARACALFEHMGARQHLARAQLELDA